MGADSTLLAVQQPPADVLWLHLFPVVDAQPVEELHEGANRLAVVLNGAR
jgi:hypothetical protein